MSELADCFFCGAFVGEVNGDGGCKGRIIGGRDICEQCLSELKYCLETVPSKSPSEREIKSSEEEDFEEENVEKNNNDNHIKASPKV